MQNNNIIVRDILKKFKSYEEASGSYVVPRVVDASIPLEDLELAIVEQANEVVPHALPHASSFICLNVAAWLLIKLVSSWS